MSATFSDLEKKHDGFKRPFLAVSVDASPDTSPDVLIRNAEITLSCGYEASCCTFELMGKGDSFQKKELKLDPAVEKYLKLGTALELSAGYNDADGCESVFSGFVTAVTLKLEGSRISHLIEAMDCKALMMNNLRSEVKEGLKKDSEAVAGVLKTYGSATSTHKLDETAERTTPIEQYNQSDYAFLVELARRNNYLFYVDRGKVNFIGYGSAKEVGVVLTPGSHLFHLERTATMSRQVKSVMVRGYDQTDPEKPIEATATKADAVGAGSKTAGEACKLVGEESQLILIDGSVRTEAQAKSRAEAEWQRASLDFVTAALETAGTPALRPGELIKLEEFSAGMDGEYLITEVVHKVDIGSYHTVCKLRRSRD